MKASQAPGLTNDERPEGCCYVAAIFLSGAALWVLLTLIAAIRPRGEADVCGGVAAMCCRWCEVFAWFTIVPVVGFFFSVVFFLPGFLIVRSIARRVAWWRPAHWIPAWLATGIIAAILLAVMMAITDRKIILLNIHNGILWQRAMESVGLMIGLGFFGLLCGIFYWLILARRSAAKESIPKG